MKRHYINPAIEVMREDLAQMLCQSVTFGPLGDYSEESGITLGANELILLSDELD